MSPQIVADFENAISKLAANPNQISKAFDVTIFDRKRTLERFDRIQSSLDASKLSAAKKLCCKLLPTKKMATWDK